MTVDTVVYTTVRGDPVEEIPADILRYSYRLNRPGAVQLQVPVVPPSTRWRRRRYAEAMLATGPVAYWRLGETTGLTAADSSGNGHDGTYVNGPTLGQPGLIVDTDTAVAFDGVNDHVAVPQDPALQITGALTVQAWVKPTALGSNRMIVWNGTTNNAVRHYMLRLNPNGSIAWSCVLDTGAAIIGAPSGTISPGGSYHVAATRDASLFGRIYVNGVQVVEGQFVGAVVVGTPNSMRIGSFGDSADFFNGVIDEVAVHNYALTPEQVAELYQEGTAPSTVPETVPSKTVRANIEEGVHEIAIRRNRQLVWAGPILTVEETDDRGRHQLAVGGEGLMAYLRRWHVTSRLDFQQVDQLTIARSLIDHHQAKAGGDFGLDTSGAELSGRLRDRVYEAWELKNIFDALVELAEVEDGFDFVFDPETRRFVPHYPRLGRVREDVVFDGRNIRSFQRRRDATSQASQVFAVGAGEGDAMLAAAVQSSTAVARYGLTQAVLSAKDVSVLDTLVGHAQDTLSAVGSVPNLLSVEVSTDSLFSWGVGDEPRIRWDSLYAPVNERQRVVGFDVEFQDGEERAVVHLEAL